MIHLAKISPCVAAFLLLATSQPHAAGIQASNTFQPYIGVFGGISLLPDVAATDTIPFAGSGNLKLKMGSVAGAVIGTQLNESWRVEAEVSRLFNGINNFTFNNGNVNTYSGGGVNQTYALANVWYGLNANSAFTPYVGGGVGLGWANGNLDMGSGRFVNATAPAAFAFQLGAGVNYAVSESFSIDVGYRFKAMTGLNSAVTTNWGGPDRIDQSTIGAHTVQIGATLKF